MYVRPTFLLTDEKFIPKTIANSFTPDLAKLFVNDHGHDKGEEKGEGEDPDNEEGSGGPDSGSGLPEPHAIKEAIEDIVQSVRQWVIDCQLSGTERKFCP